MSKIQNTKSWTALREAVIVRDFEQCTCCLGAINETDILDVDHTVPRGAGGSDRMSNLSTLCRKCHDAKHGNGIAPTVRLQSSGDMSDVEFTWFKHLLNQVLPTLADQFSVRLQPKFGLADDSSWYLPLGDLRRLDRQLFEANTEYRSLRAGQYM
jgi:hypothetical protein